MKIQINGEPRDLGGERLTVADLIGLLGMKTDRVAVELNRQIVPRPQWAQAEVQENDSLEIVHFVGGGSGCKLRT